MNKIIPFILLTLSLSIHLSYLNAKEVEQNSFFDLPLRGSSGYAFVDMFVRQEASLKSPIVGKLKQSEGFTILEEVGKFWKISTKGGIGYVKHKYCYINLPDILPSIVYKNTNSVYSVLKVGDIEIPNITKEILYYVLAYNPRLHDVEFIMPIKYETAKKLSIAQKEALKEGNTLIIYETFRPYKVQRKIVENLTKLVHSNKKAHDLIISYHWLIGWFISTRVSNHQRGSAVDLSLGKVLEKTLKTSGDYSYAKITKAKEYKMQTNIHELSINSAIFDNPKVTTYSNKVNPHTLKLHKYMKSAGFSPLASEWWHFDDKSAFESKTNRGDYFIDKVYSKEP